MMATTSENRIEPRPIAAMAFLASLAARVTDYRRNRRVVRDLTALDDHLLRDIGLSRVDVVQASVAELGEDRMAMLDRARMDRVR